MLAEPLFKWVGGKRKVWPLVKERFPKKFVDYYEPFLGGGGAFYNTVRSMHKPDRQFYASDINWDLVNVCNMVDRYPERVIKILDDFYRQYRRSTYKDVNGYRLYFYGLRTCRPRHPVTRAAWFIFMMRMSFNGLYGVNKAGYLTIGVGDFKNTNPFNYNNIHQISIYLRANNVHVRAASFEKITNPEVDDFVYCDPPYQATGTGGACQHDYDQNSFNMQTFKKFVEVCNKWSDSGCHVMVSNADVPEVRDNFKGWQIYSFDASQHISGTASARVPRREVIITNYATNTARQATLDQL